MNRFKSLKYALPVAVFLASTALSLTAAKADYSEWWESDDGSVSLWHDDATGKTVVLIEHDGKYGIYDQQAVIDAVMDKVDNSNPNPEDPNNGKGTSKPDIEALIKNTKGASWTVKVNPEDSPLGGTIDGNGGGKVPHWNPGDDDGGKGPINPPDNKPHGGLTAEQKASIEKQLNQAAREAALGGQNMFDGSEGGNESWGGLNVHGKNSSSNNGKPEGDRGDSTVYGDDYKDNNVPKGEDLGPKPELVNPTPELKGGGHAKKHIGSIKLNHTKTGGKETGKSGKTDGNTAVLSPGLLEGGNSFSYNGPAGTGAGLGSGHSGGAIQGPTTRAHR